MRAVRPTLLLVFLTAQSTAAIAAAPDRAYQVADIAPNAPAQNQGGWVYPSFFQPVTDGDVFLAPAGTGSPSIWRTDGTPDGTRPVVAGATIGNGALIGSNGQRAYFAASESRGTTALWATDGTPGGTVLLKAGLEFPYDPGSFEPDTAVLEGRLYFHDCAPRPSTACDLWMSDGTVEGTRKLAELGRRATRLTGSAGVVYFLASAVDDSHPALWRTDGTPDGTISLRTFSSVGPTNDVASVGGRALVVAEGKLWVSNGTAVDSIATLGSQEYINFGGAAVEGGTLYFLARPSNGGTTLTVWRSDGTPAGTSTVLSTSVAFSPSMPYPWVQQHGSRVYYLMPGPQGHEPYALWSSGAGGQGAQPVTCGGCSSIPYPGWILVSGGKLLFPAVSGYVHTLWAVDSAHVPRAVAPYCTGYCRTDAAVVVDAGAMFPVSATLGGYELWVTDGSAAGTRSVGSFKFFASLYVSTNLDGVLFAASPEPFRETNLWVSRGTPQSTVPLTAVEGDGSEPRELRRAGDRVAFLACREPQGLWGAGALEAELVKEGYVDCFSTSGFQPFVSAGESAFFGQSEVWATDGTAASTRKVWDNGADSSFVHDMAAFGADLVFWTSRVVADQRMTSLWRSDGTAAGTTRSLDLPPGVGPVVGSTTLGGELYFRAQSPYLQVWRTDGTTGGTRRLTDEPIGEFLQDPEFTRVGSFVYFTGDHGIWRTNGAAAGTILAIPGPQDDNPNGIDRLSWLHEQGGALLFMRRENGVSTLWRTQGTPASTQQIAALRATTGPPRSAASFGGHLYFAADDGAHGVELWRTDGTAAGTILVRDIGLGPISGNPRELVVAKGKLYFTAADTLTGRELWVSDGSAGGTRMVQDIASHAASSSPADLTVVGDLLYFSADDAVTGRELWALPLGGHPAPFATWLTTAALPGYRFQVRIGGDREGARETNCPRETLCVSGAKPGRSEVLVRVIGPRPNGYLWPHMVKFTVAQVEVWIEQTSSGEVQYYELAAAPPDAGVLDGLFDRLGFLPGPATSEAAFTDAAVGPPPPSATWLTTARLPGFRFQVQIGGNRTGVIESDCLAETLCVSGAVAGRSEVFVRIIGPRPNGYLWPNVVKFTTSRIQVWIEQKKTGQVQYYDLPAANPDAGILVGLFDRTAFRP
ncbi:MAG TPA: ELWxxDGT repeat protein [Thermoanaerobaculia bacterium]|nr:ELWxxDGT repeat protein [Thermoanaerobaculia bacterium]